MKGYLLRLAGCLAVMTILLLGCAAPPQSKAAESLRMSEWRPLAQGLEWRVLAPADRPLAQVVALRIDPARYDFRAHYRPGAPQRLDDWRDDLADAVALVNANFFDENHHILGLLVSDGVRHGQPYTGRGGIFTVQNGSASVQPNRLAAPGEDLFEQAVQAFPMLVQDGSAVYTGSRRDRVTRRTAIGQDSEGRILLLATTLFGMRLSDWSAFLAESDLGLTNAFNLDGGGSTMMLIAAEGFSLPSFDAVPAVLAVYPRPDTIVD